MELEVHVLAWDRHIRNVTGLKKNLKIYQRDNTMTNTKRANNDLQNIHIKLKIE